MELKQVYKNEQFKAVNLNLKYGEELADHKTLSQALLIVTKGKANVVFADRRVELTQGMTFIIPPNEVHKVQAIEDFTAAIIFSIIEKKL